MKKIIIVFGVVIGLLGVFIACQAQSQSLTKPVMKLNAGIITAKISESKKFYTEVLNFGITFENEFYVLMHTPNHQAEIGFLLPDHPSQRPIFQPAFSGKGIFFTIEVPDVDAEYKRIKALGIPIEIEIRNEPWGDRHFAIVDPNGVGVDIVTYVSPEK
ncbi:MAG TPA: VOC family protein [Ohtaekwangia sp.]